jgi:P27 family predicted phage terminase small subunit
LTQIDTMAKGRKQIPVTARSQRKTAAPTPPEYLGKEAREEYRRLVGVLLAAGSLDQTDSRLIEAYAIQVSMLRDAHRAIAKDGAYIEGSHGGTVAHPATNVINTATMRIKGIIEALGLTPASAKHGGANIEPAEDKWGGLLGVTG